MSNPTIVVGGNVAGNISSCEFKVTTMTMERKNLFTTIEQSLAVNNCTGETIKSSYWSCDFFAIFILVVFIGIIVSSVIKAVFDY